MHMKLFMLINFVYETAIKRRKMLEYRAFLDKSQWWPPEDHRMHQLKNVQRLVAHAFEHVPYWRETSQRLGLTHQDIKSLDDIRKLPIIDKKDIRANKDRMIADNWRGKTWSKSTGGSTGIPLHLDYTPDSYDWRMAISQRGYGWAKCEPGRKVGYLWSVAIGEETFFHKIKATLHDMLLGRKMFNLFRLDSKLMDRCVQYINRARPEGMIGYTTALYAFAKYVKQNHIKLLSVPAVVTGAERLYPYQRELIEEVLGAKVFNSYGCREFMLIASECDRHEGLHVSAENLLVELLKDGEPVRPGEIGEVVVTDLHNYGMPFIRYRTGDLAVKSERLCSCGRGLPLIDDVEGRTLDTIRACDGRMISGVFFPHLMKELKGIERFQVIQDKPDHLEIKIIRNDLFTDAELQFMKNEILKTVGAEMRIDLTYVDDILLTATGKFRVTISQLEQ